MAWCRYTLFGDAGRGKKKGWEKEWSLYMYVYGDLIYVGGAKGIPSLRLHFHPSWPKEVFWASASQQPTSPASQGWLRPHPGFHGDVAGDRMGDDIYLPWGVITSHPFRMAGPGLLGRLAEVHSFLQTSWLFNIYSGRNSHSRTE